MVTRETLPAIASTARGHCRALLCAPWPRDRTFSTCVCAWPYTHRQPSSCRTHSAASSLSTGTRRLRNPTGFFTGVVEGCPSQADESDPDHTIATGAVASPSYRGDRTSAIAAVGNCRGSEYFWKSRVQSLELRVRRDGLSGHFVRLWTLGSGLSTHCKRPSVQKSDVAGV
jgi:hypothetical protein